MCRVDYADEYMQGLQQKVVRGRKPYRCCECSRQIEVGERHEYYAGAWEGGVQSFRTCLQCTEARSWLVKECGGFLFTEVLDELHEHWNDEPSLRSWELARLIAGMRRRSKGELAAVAS